MLEAAGGAETPTPNPNLGNQFNYLTGKSETPAPGSSAYYASLDAHAQTLTPSETPAWAKNPTGTFDGQAPRPTFGRVLNGISGELSGGLDALETTKIGPHMFSQIGHGFSSGYDQGYNGQQIDPQTAQRRLMEAVGLGAGADVVPTGASGAVTDVVGGAVRSVMDNGRVALREARLNPEAGSIQLGGKKVTTLPKPPETAPVPAPKPTTPIGPNEPLPGITKPEIAPIEFPKVNPDQPFDPFAPFKSDPKKVETPEPPFQIPTRPKFPEPAPAPQPAAPRPDLIPDQPIRPIRRAPDLPEQPTEPAPGTVPNKPGPNPWISPSTPKTPATPAQPNKPATKAPNSPWIMPKTPTEVGSPRKQAATTPTVTPGTTSIPGNPDATAPSSGTDLRTLTSLGLGSLGSDLLGRGLQTFTNGQAATGPTSQTDPQTDPQAKPQNDGPTDQPPTDTETKNKRRRRNNNNGGHNGGSTFGDQQFQVI